MIYGRLGWPTGYPNTSASFGVLGFWTLVGIGAERALAWPLRSLALGAAVPALGFALLTQSRGAAFTLVLVAPFAIALVRERLRLTAFLEHAIGLANARCHSEIDAEAPLGVRVGGPTRAGKHLLRRRTLVVGVTSGVSHGRTSSPLGRTRRSRSCHPASRPSRSRLRRRTLTRA